MFANQKYVLAGALLIIISPTTAVPTRTEIQACAHTIELLAYASAVSYSTTNATEYNVSYSYNPTSCTDIPVADIHLEDTDSYSYVTCTLAQSKRPVYCPPRAPTPSQ
jgi:hypothetical protein